MPDSLTTYTLSVCYFCCWITTAKGRHLQSIPACICIRAFRMFCFSSTICILAHPSGPAIKRTSRISQSVRRTSAAATSLSASAAAAAAAASFNSIAIAEERMNASCASAHQHNHFITNTEKTLIVADVIVHKARRNRASLRWRLEPDSARRKPLRHGPSPPSSIECQAWCPASQDPSST